MPRLWLTLDCSFLAHRAFHTTGDLRHEGEATGVTFGILKEIASLCERFQTRDLIATFDVGKTLREQEFPYYKETRRKRTFTDEEQARRDELRTQLTKLRTEYLPRLGVTNILGRKGLEADDMMALVARSLEPDERAVMVTADSDILQLLSRQVACHNPITRTLTTAKQFRHEKGIAPADWVKVKALTGCDGDDIPGIDGVAEKTAIKYLRGELKENAAWKKIKEWKASQQYADNIRLIDLQNWRWGELPVRVDLDRDARPCPDAWADLAAELGMHTLVDALGGGRSVRGPVGASRG